MRWWIMATIIALNGCTASIQPYPQYSKKEITTAFQQLDDKITLLAQKVAELSPKKGK